LPTQPLQSVADTLADEAAYNLAIWVTAHRHFSQQLNAVLRGNPTRQKLYELCARWEIEALR
jgi:hypothetical protein